MTNDSQADFGRASENSSPIGPGEGKWKRIGSSELRDHTGETKKVITI